MNNDTESRLHSSRPIHSDCESEKNKTLYSCLWLRKIL